MSKNMRKSDMDTSPAFAIHNLYLKRGGRELYRNFSLEIERNAVTVILAPSGQGKTTLLDWIGGILENEGVTVSGSLSFSGIDKKPQISYLFQEPRLIPSLTVLKNVQVPLENLMGKAKSRAVAGQFLSKAGLRSKMDRLPGHLSGGEKQRTAIARAFAYPSELMLLDEAFQSQDIKLKIRLMQLFVSMLNEKSKTVVMVTHDIKEAVCLADRIVVMNGSPLQIILDRKVTVSPDVSKIRTTDFTAYYVNPPEYLLLFEKEILALMLKG